MFRPVIKRFVNTDGMTISKSMLENMKSQLAKANQIVAPTNTSGTINQAGKKQEGKDSMKHNNKGSRKGSIMKLNYKKKVETKNDEKKVNENKSVTESENIKTTYVPLNSRKKSEFDSIIKDWSTTNWLDTTPIIQQKPCHILIHDKLLYENLNLFETIHNIIIKSVPEINIEYEDLESLLEVEVSNLLIGQVEPMSNLMIERNLRRIIKNVYTPFVQSNKEASYKLNKCIKDSFLVRKIFTMLNSNVKFNDLMLSKLKTIENLNKRNDISIIKDNELTLIPSFDYRALLTRLNKRIDNPIKQVTILQYRSILGHKINDFQNLQIMKNLLISEKLHSNERFVIVTGERSTSLEYFRLLKLFNKTYSDLKLRGCVVYLNSENAGQERFIPVKNEKVYNGNELYYVVEEFSEIYDIIEVL